VITGSELPDEPPEPPARGAAVYERLPQGLPTEIVGLLEYLDGRSGSDDIFRIASETHREFGHVIAIVRAAEMLDFVDTPKRTVLLAPLGRRFLAAAPAERTALWRAQILELSLFREVLQILERHPDHRVDRDLVLEAIILRMPSEDYEKVFEVLVAWARYGNLFKYDEEEEVLSLP
jgi:NitT/TauT family transport system ATP-binding protein